MTRYDSEANVWHSWGKAIQNADGIEVSSEEEHQR